MKIAKSIEEARSWNPEHIMLDSPTEIRCYFEGERQQPEPVEDTRSALAIEIEASPLLAALVDEMAKIKGVSKELLISDLENP